MCSCCKKKKKEQSTSGSAMESTSVPRKSAPRSIRRSGKAPAPGELPQPQTEEIMVALWTYMPGSSEEVHLKKGDKVRVVNPETAANNDPNENWIEVENLSNWKVGYVPKEWIAKVGDARCNEWYYDCTVTKRDIAQLLMAKGLEKGAFAVRARNAAGTDLMLTLRISDQRDAKMFRHYRIRVEKDDSYWLNPKDRFDTLLELIEYYRTNTEMTAYPLKDCPVRPPPRRKELFRNMGKGFEVDRKQITFKQELGKGNYGKVWRGVWNKTEGAAGIEVAVKEMRGPDILAGTFLQEAKVMKSLDHPNLVKIYGICTVGDPVLILMEYMEGGALLKYLQKRKKDKDELEASEFNDLLAQVAKGMSHLAHARLVHRDLAARNVLVGRREIGGGFPTVKVADFGLARALDEGEDVYHASSEVQFALKWLAPESYFRSQYNEKSDVWSFGVLIFEVLTYGKEPYKGMEGREVCEKIKNEKGWRMEKHKLISDRHYEVMRDCWRDEHTLRPKFKDLAIIFSHTASDTTATAEESLATPTTKTKTS